MPAESRQTEKRVISDKKILSKKTRDRHWLWFNIQTKAFFRALWEIYRKKVSTMAIFLVLQIQSIGRKYLQ